jgi:membrane-associated phospholipid phosphatase
MIEFDLDRDFWNFIVDFGDIAVLGPAICAASAVLWWRRHKRLALSCILSFSTCVAITAFLKFAREAEVDILGRHFESRLVPSGHAAISMTFYMSVAALLYSGIRGWRGATVAAGTVAFGITIAFATIILEWHPWTDVVRGVALGAITGSVSWSSLSNAEIRLDGLSAVAVAIIVIALLHGARTASV